MCGARGWLGCRRIRWFGSWAGGGFWDSWSVCWLLCCWAICWLGRCRTGVRVITVVFSCRCGTNTARHWLISIPFEAHQVSSTVNIVVTVTITSVHWIGTGWDTIIACRPKIVGRALEAVVSVLVKITPCTARDIFEVST